MFISYIRKNPKSQPRQHGRPVIPSVENPLPRVQPFNKATLRNYFRQHRPFKPNTFQTLYDAFDKRKIQPQPVQRVLQGMEPALPRDHAWRSGLPVIYKSCKYFQT